MEEWKNINGYDNYQISNYGRVKNTKSNRLLTISVNRQGYCVVNLNVENKIKTYYVHRLVAEHFLDEPSSNLKEIANKTKNKKVLVNHIDGNKSNNNINNLEWTDHSGNAKHACSTGMFTPIAPPNKGSTNGQSKLTENQVLEIRRLYEVLNYTQTELAKIYNLNSSSISMIVTRKRWKHI